MNPLDYYGLARMFEGAAASVLEKQDYLSRLDSVGGDGDHGTTMARAMGKVMHAVKSHESQKIASLLQEIGWAVMGVDGGAIGPLLGMMFISMAESTEGLDVLDGEALACAFEAGLAGVHAQTKAQPGDKTLLDALIPAVEALSASARAGESIAAALYCAAEAAEAGAEFTKTLQARFGRARNIGEQSIGSADPGATSIALIFKGFMKGITDHA